MATVQLVFTRLSVVFLLGAVFSSCSERTVKTRVDSGKNDFIEMLDPNKSTKAYEQRLNASFGNTSGLGSSDKRSAFEGAKYTGNLSGLDRKQYDRKVFDASGRKFTTKNWSDRKSYNDNLSTPEFVKQAKGVDHANSNWQSQNYSGTKNSDMAKTLMNSGDRRVEHTMDASFREKNSQLSRPKIVSSTDYQQKTIEEVRAMMGRGEE